MNVPKGFAAFIGDVIKAEVINKGSLNKDFKCKPYTEPAVVPEPVPAPHLANNVREVSEVKIKGSMDVVLTDYPDVERWLRARYKRGTQGEALGKIVARAVSLMMLD